MKNTNNKTESGAHRLRNVHRAILGLLLFGHLLLGIGAIVRFAPTYDEPMHLTAGYLYLRGGDLRLTVWHQHPPLAEMIAALPLLVSSPVLYLTHPYWQEGQIYAFADLFLYNNRIPADRLLIPARLAVFAFSFLLWFFLYSLASRLSNKNGALLVSFLYLLNPTFLSHSTLVTTDFLPVVFSLGAIYFFFCLFSANSVQPGSEISLSRRVIYSFFWGLTTTAAILTKFSGLALIPLSVFLFAGEYWRQRSQFRWSKLPVALLVAVSCGLSLFFLIYRGEGFSIYPEGLLALKKEITAGRSSFIFGKYSVEGWWYYFPFAFLIKTPLTLLLLLLGSAAIFVNLYRRRDFRSSQGWNYLLYTVFPALFFFLPALFTRFQIGHRHILMVYPFILLLVSIVIFLPRTRPKTIVLSLLLAGYAYGIVRISPNYLAYFNSLIGGPPNGYRYLVDSNLDWGQSLSEIGKYLQQRNIAGIYLSYFGNADPHFYGIRYRPLGMITNTPRLGDNLDFVPDYLAISVTNLQGVYYLDKNTFHWLLSYPPRQIFGYSIFLYYLPDIPGSYLHLYQIFHRMGEDEEANRITRYYLGEEID